MKYGKKKLRLDWIKCYTTIEVNVIRQRRCPKKTYWNGVQTMLISVSTGCTNLEQIEEREQPAKPLRFMWQLAVKTAYVHCVL